MLQHSGLFFFFKNVFDHFNPLQCLRHTVSFLSKMKVFGRSLAATQAVAQNHEENRRCDVWEELHVCVSCPSRNSASPRPFRLPRQSRPPPSSSSAWQLWCCAPAHCFQCSGLLHEQEPSATRQESAQYEVLHLLRVRNPLNLFISPTWITQIKTRFNSIVATGKLKNDILSPRSISNKASLLINTKGLLLWRWEAATFSYLPLSHS